jgi:hypothetical protein
MILIGGWAMMILLTRFRGHGGRDPGPPAEPAQEPYRHESR